MATRPGTDEGGKIFVGGVARDVDEGILTSYFSQFGSVVLASIMRDKFGISRGFGFVAFDPPEIAQEVLRKVHVIEGRTIEIKQAVKHDRVYGGPSGGRGMPTNGSSAVPADKDQAIFVPRQVYVGGLPFNISEAEVREYFNQFGPVVSANLKYDFGQNPPKFRGFGFVNFVEEESVEKCLENYSAHQLGGKWIEVKRSKHSHVVQGENSGTIMPQMVQGAGRGAGGAYESSRSNGVMKDPYGGAVQSDPYGGKGKGSSYPSGGSGGPYRSYGGSDQSAGPISRGGGGSSYRSTPYGPGPSRTNDPYSRPPPAYQYGDSRPSAPQPPPHQPGSASFDPYMSSQPQRPGYGQKSGGWRSQQPINPPM